MSTKTDDWEKEFDEIWEARPAPEQRTHLKEAIKNLLTSRDTRIKELEEKVGELQMEIKEMGEYD